MDTATLTITDDDAVPTAVTLSLDPSSVVESAAATAVTVTASLNNSPLPSATTVTVSRTGGTAASGTDYPAISNFTVTIPAGRSSGTTTLSFDPSQDTLAEGDETVILTGSAPGLSDGTATLTITDDDAAPTAVSLSLEPRLRRGERRRDCGDCDRLAEQLPAAVGDDRYGEQDGRNGRIGHRLSRPSATSR